MKNKSDFGALLRLEGVAVATMNTVNLRGEIDKRVRRVFKMCESDSEIVRGAANEAIREYVETQREMFKDKGMNPDRALKEAIVATGERMASGTEIVRIVPRGETLEELDTGNGNGDHALSIAASRGTGERVGLFRDMNRGKYNDGHMLINQAALSVEVGEVVPFGFGA